MRLIAGGLLVFFLAYFSINTDVGSDPRLTLVVSQVLVNTGAPFLDPYAGGDLLDRPFDSYVVNGDILELDGRYVNYFPLGPSLISAPFVAIAQALGSDMRTTDNYELQRLMSAVTVSLVFLLAFALARNYLDCGASLALALVTVLGSTLLSTLGTALWSHNYAVLFSGAALLLIVREESGKSSSLSPALLGLVLFLSFINRPSTVALIVPVMAYLLWHQRRAFVIAALTSAILLTGYLAWNASTTGVLLPEYFSTSRLQVVRAPMWVGIAGNLISPSRGLLVFSPFLLPVLVGYVMYWRTLLRRPIVWLCLVWFGLQLAIIARAASWWGGWSFGPRLMTDIWPGLIVLTAILWAFLLNEGEPRARRAFEYAFLSLGVVAMTLHVVQGLYSQPASRWNGYVTPVPPESSQTQLGDLFSWRYAQPLAGNLMLCAIERSAAEAYSRDKIPIYRYPLGQTFLAAEGLSRGELPKAVVSASLDVVDDPPDVTTLGSAVGRVYLPLVVDPSYSSFYLGWSAPAPFPQGQVTRWSQCPVAEIWLNLAPDPTAESVVMEVTGLTNDAQEVEVAVNNQVVGTMNWSGQLETRAITFPASLVHRDGLTQFAFSFHSAHYPNLRDQRPLGLALVELTLCDLAAEDVRQSGRIENQPACPP